MLCSGVKHLGNSDSTEEVERNIRLHFFRAIAASCVLYNKTEHSRGFISIDRSLVGYVLVQVMLQYIK